MVWHCLATARRQVRIHYTDRDLKLIVEPPAPAEDHNGEEMRNK